MKKLLEQIAKMQEAAKEVQRPGAYEPRHAKRQGMTSLGYFAFDMVHMLEGPEMQEALAEAKGGEPDFVKVGEALNASRQDAKTATDAPNSTTGGQGFDAYGSETPVKTPRRKK